MACAATFPGQIYQSFVFRAFLFSTSLPITCTFHLQSEIYLPIRRIGRGPNLSIRIPSGRVVALSRKLPMVKPKFNISSWSTQLSHSSTSPSEEELPRDTTTESFAVGTVADGVIRQENVNVWWVNQLSSISG